MCQLALSDHLIKRVRIAYDQIKKKLPQSEVYLFGSYAKRKVRPESDVDLLVLVDDSMDKLTLKKIKWEIEEAIEEAVAYEYEVDMKLYTKAHFEKRSASLGFEAAIAEYMIPLEESTWR